MNKDATAPEAPPSYQETMGQQPYPHASAGAGKTTFCLFSIVALATQKGPKCLVKSECCKIKLYNRYLPLLLLHFFSTGNI